MGKTVSGKSRTGAFSRGMMHVMGTHRMNPELREVVVEASLALARLDAKRLEELALSCQALNRDLVALADTERRETARQARDAAGEMTVFGRVLDETRANLDVINRMRQPRGGRLEYGGIWRLWALAEKGNGDR